MIRTGNSDVGCTIAAPVTISPTPARARSSWNATSRALRYPFSTRPVPIGGCTIRLRIASAADLAGREEVRVLAHSAVAPPSATSSDAVKKLASSENRKHAAVAISSGSATRA